MKGDDGRRFNKEAVSFNEPSLVHLSLDYFLLQIRLVQMIEELGCCLQTAQPHSDLNFVLN